MIYVPKNDTYKYCPYVVNANSIRVYDRTPQNNITANYREYHYNSSYAYTDGQQTWGNYSVTPHCLSDNEITSNVFYRNDIDKILVCFIILLIICFYFPYRIISRMFGRWLKL